MKRILVILCVMAFCSFLNCQITMQTNLPKALPLNSDITFEVKINKGTSANFAKYQMEIPRGVSVKEVDSKLGSFTTEENVVKIIWVMAPVETDFTISLKLNTGIIAGKRMFVQKYFYIENDIKKEVEMEPVLTVFKDSVSSGPSVSTSEFVAVSPKAMPSLLTTTINASEISTKNPGLLIQQIMQLKRDSKDAYVVGEREKQKAEVNISEANAALANAEKITDETEKKSAMEKANQAKLKAENDLQVAERVLTLAKSLDDNANEIETINRSVNPGSYSGQTQKADPTIAARNKALATTNPAEGTIVNIDEKDNLPEANKKNSKKSKVKNEELTEKEMTGLIFKIQLGAFSKEPSKKDFKAIGKVKIVEENSLYKVLLYDSFLTKDEAFKQREQIIAKGFDGFVVSYQDGLRIK